MGQMVNHRKKKGRPSKADLARRTSQPEIDVRRSRRRRNLRFNLDYDDYLDDDEEDEELIEEDDEEVRRREKKLKLKLNHLPDRSGSRGEHARSNGGSESEDESERERKPLKKRRIDGCADDDDEDDEEEVEERGRRVDFKLACSLPETPTEHPSGIPLPEKKKLELMLDKLQKKDTYGVYAEPVDPEELPDYHDVIKHPMDFGTVRKKLRNGSFDTLEQFEILWEIFMTLAEYVNCLGIFAMPWDGYVFVWDGISGSPQKIGQKELSITAETIYHKQARSIQELARKKFYKLRNEFESSAKEMKSEQKPRSNIFIKKQMKKPLCQTSQEPIGSDFSSGATLATGGNLQNSSIPTQAGGYERPDNADRLVENNSSLDDMNLERTEELSSGKGLSKLGKKSFVPDENRRVTYNIANEPAVRSESIFTTFEGEIKQLVAVGLHDEYSYARSLARFAATMGPAAWKVASHRIEEALPAGCKFGLGWVGEYEPLPTTVLLVDSRSQKESSFARRSQSPAGLRKDDETFKTSLSPREHLVNRPTPEQKSSPFNPRGSSLERKPSFLAPAGTRPSTPSIATYQHQSLPSEKFADVQSKVLKQVELNSLPSVSGNNVDPVAERQRSNGSEMATSRGRESVSRNTNNLQSTPFKQPNSNGVVAAGLANGNFTGNNFSNRMMSPSPDSVPNQMARTATFFPRGHEQVLTDPVQLMRMLSEKAQTQQEPSNQPPVDAPPPKPTVRREDSTNSPNAASVAARAWMSIGAAGFKQAAENPSAHKVQISAGSLYNPTMELHPQFTNTRPVFPPGGMQFQSARTRFSHPTMVPQVRMGNEGQQSRPMIFPQLAVADLSRFQSQPPWRGLSPHSQARQKQDTFPPDLNIGFQSPGSTGRQSSGVMVDSQQPDLVLQL